MCAAMVQAFVMPAERRANVFKENKLQNSKKKEMASKRGRTNVFLSK
jgi:hypothetical protein